MRTITLANGNKFVSFYGGQERPGYAALPASNLGKVGPFSFIRNYHNIKRVELAGIEWVHITKHDANWPEHGSQEWLSLCGRYHIVDHSTKTHTQFYAFTCSTWRANLKSTFGNLVGPREPVLSAFDAACGAFSHQQLNH